MAPTLWLAFRDLAKGEHFCFAYGVGTGAPVRHSAIIHTKTGKGWYTDGLNKFRTGPTTAVARVGGK